MVVLASFGYLFCLVQLCGTLNDLNKVWFVVIVTWLIALESFVIIPPSQITQTGLSYISLYADMDTPRSQWGLFLRGTAFLPR